MGKPVDYNSNPNWVYLGDINAAYGGMWLRHYGDYCDAIEITDLDSATGFTGAVMIERKGASLPGKLRTAKATIKSALSVYGWSIGNLRGMRPSERRTLTWQAMLAYGYGDTDTLEILQLEPDGPMQSRDGWKADRRQTGGDIGAYVMAKYLD